MGSDDGDKHWAHSYFRSLSSSPCGRLLRGLASRALPWARTRSDNPTPTSERKSPGRRTLTFMLLGSLVLLWAFLAVLSRLVPPPERVLSDTFAQDQAVVPDQCAAAAEHFFRCQKRATQTLVLACHRRWCNSWGFCEPCNGLGDRMRFLMSRVHEEAVTAAKHAMAVERESDVNSCVRIQLDYPVQDVATLDSALYQDPGGWWAHVLRRRTYSLGPSFHKEPQPRASWGEGAQSHHLRNQGSRAATNSLTVSHFSPKGYVPKDYDPCYFHLLFRPAPSLLADIDRHVRALMRSSDVDRRTEKHHQRTKPLPSIGIHLRTGDVTAFGVQQNDTRVTEGDLEPAWNKMLDCADELSRSLFPAYSAETVPYFVATDSRLLKERIAAGALERSASAGRKRVIYTTDVAPQSSWRAWEGDRDAWMELYLLSMQSGLVVNVRPSGYAGGAGRTSYFSRLAQKVGFMGADRVRECVLE